MDSIAEELLLYFCPVRRDARAGKRGLTSTGRRFRLYLSFLWDVASAARKGVSLMTKLPAFENGCSHSHRELRVIVEGRKGCKYLFLLLFKAVEFLELLLKVVSLIKSLFIS